MFLGNKKKQSCRKPWHLACTMSLHPIWCPAALHNQPLSYSLDSASSPGNFLVAFMTCGYRHFVLHLKPLRCFELTNKYAESLTSQRSCSVSFPCPIKNLVEYCHHNLRKVKIRRPARLPQCGWLRKDLKERTLSWKVRVVFTKLSNSIKQ